MRGFSRGVGFAVGVWALTLAGGGAAVAQDNLDQGKSGAQLYAADCAICHKSPQKLDTAKAGGLFGLDSFLREHYTASRESAAAISAYLKGVHPEAPSASARGRTHKQTAKGGHRAKDGKDAKDAKGESREAPAAAKPAESKPVEAKPTNDGPKTTASTKPKKPVKPE